MLIACAVAVLAVAGCGDDDGERTIDPERVESYVRDTTVAPRLIADVSCPSGLEAEEGQVFDCAIRLHNGAEETITLRQSDEEGRLVRIGSRQVTAPRDRRAFRIIPENVEALIRESAPERADLLSVDCPAGKKVRRGNDFDCVARRTGGGKIFYRIHQRDDLGNVEIAASRTKR